MVVLHTLAGKCSWLSLKPQNLQNVLLVTLTYDTVYCMLHSMSSYIKCLNQLIPVEDVIGLVYSLLQYLLTTVVLNTY